MYSRYAVHCKCEEKAGIDPYGLLPVTSLKDVPFFASHCDMLSSFCDCYVRETLGNLQ